MADQRLVASVTWGDCPGTSRPHLGEMILYEGNPDEVYRLMLSNHISFWKIRHFSCQYCSAQIHLPPAAVLIVDVPRIQPS